MIITNSRAKAMWIHYEIEGVPKKVFLGGNTSIEVSDITHADQLNLNSIDESLDNNIGRGKNYKNPNLERVYYSNSVNSKGLILEFSDLSSFLTAEGFSNDVSGWNTFFETDSYATTPFSQVETDGDTVKLMGSEGLIVKDLLFEVNTKSGDVAYLTSVNDELGVILKVGLGTFQEHTTLEQITIPDAIEVGGSSFEGCVSLTGASLDNLITMGIKAFYGTGLYEAYFPKVTNISASTFSQCSNLTSVSLPLADSTEGQQSFSYCDLLTDLNFPSLTEISEYAFFNDPSVSEVTNEQFPLLTQVGDRAFSHCGVVTISLTGATTISSYAFTDNLNLETIYLPNLISLGTGVWDNTVGQTITLTIPTSFNTNSSVTNLIANNTVTLINT